MAVAASDNQRLSVTDTSVANTVLAPMKTLLGFGGFFSTLAFTVGWSYLSSYLFTFGFGPLDVEISSLVATSLAPHVLSRWLLPLIAISTVVSALFLLAQSGRLKSRATNWLAVLFVVMIYVATAVAGVNVGRENARRDMLQDSSRLPTVGFVSDLTDARFPRCVSDGALECRLLMYRRGVYYVFIPITSKSAGDGRSLAIPDVPFNITLFALPESHVKFVRIVRGAR